MQKKGWSVHYSSRDLPEGVQAWWSVPGLPVTWDSWLDEAGIPDGTPYLMSPVFAYDTALNAYFHRVVLLESSWHSQNNAATALARFFNFLYVSRGGKDWRQATEADHLAFHQWRRRDERGPAVEGSTWSQEVSHVNQFYLWAVGKRLVAENPVPQRARRTVPAGVVPAARRGGTGAPTVPATYAHDEAGESIEWLPAASYRSWRDVGVRGYGADGLPRRSFRGRWSSRNACYSDLMVRTGMRISEQSSVAITELPTGLGPAGFRRFWLPEAIAKGGSARWVYVPASVGRDLTDYRDYDRAEVVADAQAKGRYRRIRRPVVIEEPERPLIATRMGGQRVDVRHLKPPERYRLLRVTEDGLEPAMFWLGESGMPLAVSTWKDMFTTANQRCRDQGLDLHAHAHLLRHTFAVITLEQLQRGHIAALAGLDAGQRTHYTRIFGDPLDWVRRRLGHRSVTTTLIYLHALQELEMETRMALVPDTWEDPRSTPLDELGTSEDAPAGMAVREAV
ncbi:site-specific integrase [Streptomyces rubiginosohelvolus]|uniref:site-specific integrase n=1 Tax=Streptomyces rubiginosohelvolus TaxID=67362 RepID=UPI0033C7B1CA